jgi:hypothetical protein
MKEARHEYPPGYFAPMMDAMRWEEQAPFHHARSNDFDAIHIVNALILIGSILRIQKRRLLCGSDAINSVGGVSGGKKKCEPFSS